MAAKTDQAEPVEQQKIVPRLIEHEMKASYLDYSMSVIVGRALPDVRDGLKPVHRRILYAMHQMGMFHNKPFKKSARIVGEVLGKFHPHGDLAVYDSLVRMAQPFSLRYLLIDGQGNFGSVDGDAPAAMRYTEARLSKLAEEMLQDIDKETVSFVPNFDGSLKEPSILPSKVPNLLVNGSSGIAVGMATNIPPHNMAEVCDGIIATIDNPDISTDQLLGLIKGPDFPTGGIILGKSGLKEAYESGRGKIVVRAKTVVEETKKRTRIIVTEIPYMVNKAQLIEEIAGLVRDRKVSGIADLRDESDREGMRVVIDLKAGANPDITLNQLFAHSRMQESFGIILLALVDNEPKILSLKELIQAFIEHRKDIIVRRTRYDLGVAEDRAHILEGLMVALEHIDSVVALIKKSKTVDEARKGLIVDYKLSEKQAQAILDMTLKRLTSLEQEKIHAEHSELLKLIAELKAILASEQRILGIIKSELVELKSKYGDARRTLLLEAETAVIEEEKLVKPEAVVVTITHAGYVKRLPVDTYKMQRRGGKGIIAAETKEEDFVENLFIANTHDCILFFTNKGKVHWLKVYQIPEAGRYARGTAIVNLLVLEPGEKITSFIPVREFKPEQYLFMVTERGIVKKTSLDQFANPRRGGIVALSLDPNDQLIQVLLTNGSSHVFIATENGLAIRFDEAEVRPMGRTAAGVIGIKLRNDRVIGAAVVDESKTIFTVTEKGFGKRSKVSDYRLTSRAGVGVRNIKVTEKNGKAVAILPVGEGDELMLITQKGVLIRTPVKDISVIGRATQGVRVMRLEEGDRVISVARIAPEENEGSSFD